MKLRSIHSVSFIAGIVAGGFVMLVGMVCGGGVMASLLLGILALVLLFGVVQMAVRKFIVYKIKPIYQIVLSRDIKTAELENQLLYKRDMVGQMRSELNVWTENNNREIARLKENEKYRREFLGNISHEMKTPMFTIQGYVQTLLDGAMDDPAVLRKYLTRTDKSIDRMISIITDLDEISKLESGVLQLWRERFDIVALTREIAEDACIDAQKAGITIAIGSMPLEESSHPPVYVTADRKYIEQVLWNLIVNSIKYGKPGGHTRISFVDMFDKVMVEVTDDGIGIAAEDLSRVFERFFRSDKSRSREMGGTGLGLSIVKHIVEAHGESITLRSQLDHGSTFSFTLSKSTV